MTKLLAAFVFIVISSVATSTLWAQDFDSGVKAYKAGDYATALKIWKPLAEQGDAQAQHYLGWLYEKGRGVPQDHAEAAKWYRKAAEQGDVKAQHYLGWSYAKGRGALSRYRRSVAENVAGDELHAAADAAAQVRNEAARSSLKCGRRRR